MQVVVRASWATVVAILLVSHRHFSMGLNAVIDGVIDEGFEFECTLACCINDGFVGLHNHTATVYDFLCMSDVRNG